MPRVALQNLSHLAHILLIILITLLVDAGRAAVFDVIFEAWFVFSDRHSLLGDGVAARAWFVDFLNNFQHRVHTADVRIRPKERSEVLIDGACL